MGANVRCSGQSANVDPQGVGDLEVFPILSLLALPAFLVLLLFPPSFLLQVLSLLPFGLAGPLLLILDSAWTWRCPLELSPAVDGEGGGEGCGPVHRSPEILCFYNAELERQLEYRGLGSSPSPTFVSSCDLE